MDTQKVSVGSDVLYRLLKTAAHIDDSDLQLQLRRLVRSIASEAPEYAGKIKKQMASWSSNSSMLRGNASSRADAQLPTPLPIDRETRLSLVRKIHPVILPISPTWPNSINKPLQEIIRERKLRTSLIRKGVSPIRTALFTGPPGVGKTFAAMWIAQQLELPLLILDLASVMSSLLGRTGTNIKHILEHAKSIECVLLLDEFDAIAKRRDDTLEHGELKRLVTVLLQEIDAWPDSNLLLAATNHPGLLDPAAWRRFDLIVDFPYPPKNDIVELIIEILKDHDDFNINDAVLIADILLSLKYNSYSDINKQLNRLLKFSILENYKIIDTTLHLYSNEIKNLNNKARIDIALHLYNNGTLSKRKIQEITGVANPTLNKALRRGKHA